MIGPDTPASVEVTPGERGGLSVTVRVPTYSGGMDFTIDVERDEDGDWRVFVPWPDGLREPYTLDNDAVVSNGVAYLGAPDVEISDAHT